jgi:hypothetical protein
MHHTSDCVVVPVFVVGWGFDSLTRADLGIWTCKCNGVSLFAVKIANGTSLATKQSVSGTRTCSLRTLPSRAHHSLSLRSWYVWYVVLLPTAVLWWAVCTLAPRSKTWRCTCIRWVGHTALTIWMSKIWRQTWYWYGQDIESHAYVCFLPTSVCCRIVQICPD